MKVNRKYVPCIFMPDPEVNEAGSYLLLQLKNVPENGYNSRKEAQKHIDLLGNPPKMCKFYISLIPDRKVLSLNPLLIEKE